MGIEMPTWGLDGLDQEGEKATEVMSIIKDSSVIEPANLDVRMEESKTETSKARPIVNEVLPRTGQ